MSLFVEARFSKKPIVKPTNGNDLKDQDCLKIMQKGL